MMARNWKKILGVSVALGLLVIIGLVAVVAYALVTAPAQQAFVIDKAYYQILFRDKTGLPLPHSAVFMALEDTLNAVGMESECTARCLLQVDSVKFQQVRAAIQGDTAFTSGSFDALTNSTLQPQPTKVIAAAKRMGLRKQDFTQVFTRKQLGRYRLTLGFHQQQHFIFLNYQTY